MMKTISYLSEILQIDKEEIYEAIEGRRYMRYLPLQLKSDITMETISQLSEHRWKLKGVNMRSGRFVIISTGRQLLISLVFLGQGPVDESTRECWAGEGYDYEVASFKNVKHRRFGPQTSLRSFGRPKTPGSFGCCTCNGPGNFYCWMNHQTA